MRKLTNWQFGALVLGAVGVGAALSGLIGADRRSGVGTVGPAPTLVLADPLDPAKRPSSETPAASMRGSDPASPPPATAAGASSNDEKALAAQGDRASQTRAKEILKARVLDGGASDSERRMLKALCRLLDDQSCVD